MSEFITARLGGSFLISAGICGFIRFLEENDAVRDRDYFIKGTELSVSCDYIRNNDIHKMYVQTMVSIFENVTKFNRIANEESKIIESLYKNELGKAEMKKLNDLYKNFEDMMLKASFKSAYVILENYDHILPIYENVITDLKKEKDLAIKYQKYHDVLKLLEQEEVKRILIFKELMYSKINLFFDGVSFFLPANLKKPIEDLYKEDFYAPLLEEIDSEEKKKKKVCIECLSKTSSSRPMSFVLDTTDDVNKKKNYYWNCKPDAYICPICAFLYTFIPLGFAFIGAEAIFINSNGDIDNIYRIMSSYRDKVANDDKTAKNKRLYRVFTEQKADMIFNRHSNFQVILRSPDLSHFKFNIIDRELAVKLNHGKKYLSMLEKRWINLNLGDGKEFSSVYDNVFDCIISHRSLYPIVDKILKNEIDQHNNINYLEGILKLHIIFYGGAEMEDLNKKVTLAHFAGMNLRRSILGDKASTTDNEDDNSMRGFVYRLVNLASVGDCPQFIDTVIRTYAGFNLTIPSIFKECYKSDEVFKAIAHGFVLGLKYVKYESTNKEEN